MNQSDAALRDLVSTAELEASVAHLCSIGEKVSGTEEERNAMFGEYFAFSDSIRDQTVEAAPLEPSTASTTVRVRDGETLVTDGPFAETKEQLDEHCLASDTLARFKRPREYRFVGELPKSPSGKILRRMLRQDEVTA